MDMIKLENIEKYYFYKKSNQIHVMNNITLEFPDTGLISILGPSGCGKTTLINVIGGLDSFKTGTITFNDTVLKHYNPRIVDDLRNTNIGYIFQNYLLFEELTVYDNIKMMLNMVGVYDKDEVDERIRYVLRAVGMERYQKRRAMALSGGQQQRVAIARALAKNPKIIIADEPTGNLDSVNTIEVMNIIKKISSKCLVILVTHETSIVDFYADRVIELKDGKVMDDHLTTGVQTLEHKDHRVIYLQDMEKSEGEISNINYKFYTDNKDTNLKVNFIFKDGTLYVQPLFNSPVKVVDQHSDVVIKDEKYRVVDKKDIESFDFEQKEINLHGKHRKSVIRFRDSFSKGWQRFANSRKLAKLFNFAFFVVGAILSFVIAIYGANTIVDMDNYTKYDLNTVAIQMIDDYGNRTKNIDDIKGLVGTEDIVLITPLETPYTLSLSADISYQTRNVVSSIYSNFQLQHKSVAENYPIYNDLGRMINDKDEVVIDRIIADQFLKDPSIMSTGISTYEHLIGREVSIDYFKSYQIVGIVDQDAPLIIVEDFVVENHIANSHLGLSVTNGFATKEYLDDYTFVSGSEIAADDEIMLPKSQIPFYHIGDLYEGFEIVGFYSTTDRMSNEATTVRLITYEALKNLLYDSYEDSQYVYVYSTNPESTLDYLNNNGFVAYNVYQRTYETATENMQRSTAGQITFAIVLVSGLVVYMYFMMRTSLLERIKEVGIYRCLGATKNDIYKMFIGEIIIFTSLTAIPGYLITSITLFQLQEAMGILAGLITLFNLTLPLFIFGFVLLYIVNIIFGLLPTIQLLWKTPSEIMSKFDI